MKLTICRSPLSELYNTKIGFYIGQDTAWFALKRCEELVVGLDKQSTFMEQLNLLINSLLNIREFSRCFMQNLYIVNRPTAMKVDSTYSCRQSN